MLPKEHGAWAMLLMPYLMGSAAGWGGWASFLLLVSILCLFVASRPLEVLLRNSHPRLLARSQREGPIAASSEEDSARERRRQAALRLVLYLGIGGSAGLLLALLYRLWALPAMAIAAGVPLAAQLPLRRRGLDRTWPARLLSIAALSATGPAAYYAGTGSLDWHTLAVWLIAFLYSGASVFYVRLVYQPPVRLKAASLEEGRHRARRQLLVYLGILALSLVLLIPLGWLPPLSSLAFVPLLLKVAWAWRKTDYHPTLKQIGLAEIGHSSLFTLLAILALVAWD